MSNDSKTRSIHQHCEHARVIVAEALPQLAGAVCAAMLPESETKKKAVTVDINSAKFLLQLAEFLKVGAPEKADSKENATPEKSEIDAGSKADAEPEPPSLAQILLDTLREMKEEYAASQNATAAAVK